MAKRSSPEVNAGSMADIAFLLLIFFLVTTTIESDKGMTRRLPPIDETESESIHKERNMFQIIINKEGDLLVQDSPMNIHDLRQATLDFIDNGAGTGTSACSYCLGPKDPKSSENPNKAVVSLQYDRQTKYGIYIAVQNEIMAAYNELRDRVSNSEYGEPFSKLEEDVKDDRKSDKEKEVLKERIKKIRDLYPLNISEAKPEKV